MHLASMTDIEEAYLVGKQAMKYSAQGHTGFMVGMKRLETILMKLKPIGRKPLK